MIDAVIFDMDGLLLDSEVYWERARGEYARSVGCDWTDADEHDAKGKNSPEWAQLIRERCDLDIPPTEIIGTLTRRMRDLYRQHLPLLPGAADAVRDVARFLPLAIASSSPPELIEYAMAAAGIRDCFQTIVSADTVGRGKPSPDVFLVAAKRLAVPPARIAVFEDSTAGILASHAAGMHTIAVPNPHFPPSAEALALAELVLPSLVDFQAAQLESLGGPGAT